MGKGSGTSCGRIAPIIESFHVSFEEVENQIEENKVFFNQNPDTKDEMTANPEFHSKKGLQQPITALEAKQQEKLALAIAHKDCPKELRKKALEQLWDANRDWVEHILETGQLFNSNEEDQKLKGVAFEALEKTASEHHPFGEESFLVKVRKNIFASMKQSVGDKKWDRKQIRAINSELMQIRTRYSKVPSGREFEDGAQLYMGTIDRTKTLDYKVQDRLIGIYQETSLPPAIRQEAKDILVVHNLKWVHKEAFGKTFKGRSLAPEEMIQEGTKGLLEAIDQYDLERGNSFITFAKHKIVMRIQRATEENSASQHGVRLPSDKYNFVHVDVARARKSLEAKLEREPTAEEVFAQVLQNNKSKTNAKKAPTLEETEEALQWLKTRSPLSMHTQASSDEGDGGDELGQFIPDNKTVESEVAQHEMAKTIDDAFSLLGEKEKAVFGSYVGYGPYEKAKSIAEVSERYGIKPLLVKKMINEARETVQNYLKQDH